MDAAANQIGVYQPNETVQGRSGRPCHIAGRFALLAVIAFAAGAAMGSGRIDLEESYMQARLTASGELYVMYKLGYDTSSTATTVDSRDFDFNISYGIVGGADTYTATMSSSGTLLPAGAGSSYQVWYIAGDGGTAPGYTSPAIPGLQSGDEVWYQVCVSNTLHNGNAPTGENDMTTTMENGVPRISWFPNFEDDPFTPRLYKVKFVDSLEDAAASNWCDYVQGEAGEASARFFKVEVRLPPAEQ